LSGQTPVEVANKAGIRTSRIIGIGRNNIWVSMVVTG
jgi:hypothetical protein